MKELQVTIFYRPPELVEFGEARQLACPILSRIEPGGEVLRVNCTISQCALWRTVIPPPGDKLGNCMGYCSIPKTHRDLIELQAKASAA